MQPERGRPRPPAPRGCSYVLEGELVFPDAERIRGRADAGSRAGSRRPHLPQRGGRATPASSTSMPRLRVAAHGHVPLRYRGPAGRRRPAARRGRSARAGRRRGARARPGGLLFKAEQHDGDGTFSLSEITIAPGFPGPVPHRHERTADSFFVLEGTLRIRLSDDELDAPAGSYAFVPPNVVHTFSNPRRRAGAGAQPDGPGASKQYLKEAVRAAEVAGGSPDPAVMAEIASRYDFVPA